MIASPKIHISIFVQQERSDYIPHDNCYSNHAIFPISRFIFRTKCHQPRRSIIQHTGTRGGVVFYQLNVPDCRPDNTCLQLDPAIPIGIAYQFTCQEPGMLVQYLVCHVYPTRLPRSTELSAECPRRSYPHILRLATHLVVVFDSVTKHAKVFQPPLAQGVLSGPNPQYHSFLRQAL